MIPAVDTSSQHEIRLRTSPAWLPEKFRQRPERLRVKFKPSIGERRVLRKQKFILPSKWAPKHRVVTYGPLAGSKWDPDFLPHLAGIMDAAVFPSVKQIGNCKAPQTGSSASLETLVSYFADMQPGSACIVYPDRETASKRSMDYLQDIFRQSPRLRSLLTGVDDDMSRMRVKLKTMLIYLAWAGSVTALGNISVRYLFLDEVDKYPETPSKKEADAISLVLERVRAFKFGAKVFFSSTPSVETGPIWKFLKEAQVVFDFHVPCPDCNKHQCMKFDLIKWPEGERDPLKVKDDKLARYVCAHCGVMWDDRMRDKALLGGIWHARGDGRPLKEYLLAEHPERICVHSPAWISRLVSLSECAAAFLKGCKDRNALKYFRNQICAEPWAAHEQAQDEDIVLALKDNRPAGLVPAGGVVAALVAGVDTHDTGFNYDIYAIGYGLEMETWQIRSGKVETFDALAQILFEDAYVDANGHQYHVHLAVQDAMGRRTTEVYDFARRFPGRLIPSMGHRRKQSPVTWGKIDIYPGTNKQIPGGLQLLHVDTTHFKNQFSSKIQINPSDPGAWHLNSDATRDYARQISAEYADENGIYHCLPGRANHHGDCCVYLLAGIEVLGVKFWAKPVPQETPVVVARKVETPNPYTRGQQMFGGTG